MDNDENVVFNNPLPPASTQQGEPAPNAPQEPIAAPTQPIVQPSQESTSIPPVNTIPIIDDADSNFTRSGIIKKIIVGIVILIILVFVIGFFLARSNSNKKVKLVWWGLWENSNVINPLISDFQKEHPDITVEYSMQDSKQYREKLQARIGNGTGPDIFRFHNTWILMINSELLPLPSDVITPSEFKKSFYSVMQKDLIQNGGIYGVPMGADTLGLFINTDLMSSAGVKPPEIWDDFVKTARTLTVKDGTKIKTAGAALGTYGNITHAPDIISLLFIQQGIDIKKFQQVDKSQKTDVLDFYTSFAKGDQNVWNSTLDESILSFSQGRLAMYMGFSWDIFRIQALNKNLHFKVYPVPQLVGRKAALASYWVEGVSAKSKNQKEALLLMQFLSKKETAQKFFTTASKTRGLGAPYARRDLANNLKENQLLFPFVNQLEYAQSSFFASDTYDGTGGINFLSNNYLGNAVNAIINDNSSSQTVVDTLDQGVGQVFRKYGIQ